MLEPSISHSSGAPLPQLFAMRLALRLAMRRCGVNRCDVWWMILRETHGTSRGNPWIYQISLWLVGGLEHGFYFPFHIWDNPSQLTFIFFKMVFAPPTSNYVTMILASSEWQNMLHDMIMIWDIMIWSIDGSRSDSNYMFQPVPLFSSCARGCCWWPMKKTCRIPTEQVPWSTTFCLEQRPKHQLICNAWSRALDISMQLQVRQIHDMLIYIQPS